MRGFSIERRFILALLALNLAAIGLYAGLRPSLAAQHIGPVEITWVDDELLPPHREPPPPPPPPSAIQTPPEAEPVAADLRGRIAGAFAASGAHTVGIAVAADGLGRVLDVQGANPLLPASTQKVYVAAAALLKLGPSARLQTQVFTTGQLEPSGVLNGDLVVLAGGDPTLMRSGLDSLAAQVAQAGIRRVTGSLYIEDSRYDQARVAGGWKPEYVPMYIGSLSAFAVDNNQWTPERRLIDDPAGSNLGLFRDSLVAAGVAVNGNDHRGWPGGVRSLAATVESPTVTEMVASMLKRSDNFIAEMLTKELGYQSGDPSTNGGLQVIRQVLGELNVGVGDLHDGSGLSYGNRTTPWNQVDLLSKMETTAEGDTFRNAMAVTCDPVGTLRNRLCGTTGAGRVFAKSGALDGVKTLTGYTTTATGRRVWFSFLLNDVISAEAARNAMDAALLAITTFPG